VSLLLSEVVAATPLELLLTQGPVGLVAGLFVWLYLAERKRNNALVLAQASQLKVVNELHNDMVTQMRDQHADQLDDVRQCQISREQEMAHSLHEYGESVVEAIDQATKLVREIRRQRHDPEP